MALGQMLGGGTSRRLEGAIRQAASALDIVDDNCRTLAADLGAVQQRQADAEGVLVEHEWSLNALREELTALRAMLPEAGASTSAKRTSSSARVGEVAPSDLHGFIAALPQPEIDDNQIAAAVRTLLTAASTNLRRESLEPEDFPWQAPMLVLASAPPDRLEAFLELLVRRNPAPSLWLIGRPRDERIVRETLHRRIQFVEYTAPGPYSLEHFRDRLPELRVVPFGACVFLDTGLWGDRVGHCDDLLRAVARDRVYCFSGDNRLYHLHESSERSRALQFTRELLAWYDERLQPVEEV